MAAPKKKITRAKKASEPKGPASLYSFERLEATYKTVRAHTIYVATSPWRFFKTLCMVVGFLTITMIVGVSVVVYSFFGSLPDMDQLAFSDLKQVAIQRVEAKFRNDRQRLRWVGIDKISRDLIYATIVSEDASFQAHDGVNYEAMLSAFAKNWGAGKIKGGGSTITQQLVKNIFLSQERSYLRKLKEFFIARSLESHFSKNEILELYLNIAEFGPEAYGVYAGARLYFKKSPRNINAAEGAFMALMLPSPRKNHYRIFVKKSLVGERKRKYRTVLRGMRYQEYITPKEYTKYLSYRFFR